MRAFTAVLALTLLLAVLAKGSFFARMIAGDSDVSRATFELPSDVITSRLRWHILRAFLLAVLAVITRWTLLIAGSSHPSSLTEAFTGLWIARGIVLAVTLMMTLSSVKA